jgi:pilus assembly protein CpaF
VSTPGSGHELDDLFVTDEPSSDLGDLFAATSAHPPDVAGPEAATGAPSEHHAGNAAYPAAQRPPADTREEASAGRDTQRERRTGPAAPEILFGTAAVTTLADVAARFAAQVPGSDTPLNEPRPEPAPRPEPRKTQKRPSRLAQARAHMDAADTDVAAPHTSWYDQLVRQQQERERLWPTIVAVLGAVSSEPSVSQEVGSWRLARDHDLYRKQRQQLELLLQPVLHLHDVSVGNPRDMPLVYDAVYDELVGIGPLGAVWRDDDVTEILVDGWDRVTVERDGVLEQTPLRFRDKEHAAQLARDLATSVSDRALNITNPLVTAELERARANFAYGPIVKSGLAISIRKFRPLLQMDRLLTFGALNADMAEFLSQCVKARATLLVSGGTGTGKTTMLNALSEYVPDDERVVTIEDSFELNLSNRHVVSLQTKEKASSDDTVRVTLADLLVNALRMRPDRIVVGEIREPHGARAMLQAATTGHDGTMTTIHANTPTMALSDRLSDLQREATGAPDEVCKRNVATAVNLVVQVLRKRGKRFISEIAVVDRSMVKGGDIVAETVFVGDIDQEGVVTFRHVGGVRADTEIGYKLTDAGFDLSRWQPATASDSSAVGAHGEEGAGGAVAAKTGTQGGAL